MPYPGLLHPEPLFLWQSTAEPHLLNTVDIQTQFCLRLCGGLWVLVHTKFLWWVWGLILNEILPLLPSFGGFSLPLDWGIIFFAFGLGYQCGVQHSPVDGCSAANCDFEVLT